MNSLDTWTDYMESLKELTTEEYAEAVGITVEHLLMVPPPKKLVVADPPQLYVVNDPPGALNVTSHS